MEVTARIDQIEPAAMAEVAGGALGSGAFESPITDHYLTNPIARASAVMAELSRLAAERKATDAQRLAQEEATIRAEAEAKRRREQAAAAAKAEPLADMQGLSLARDLGLRSEAERMVFAEEEH